MSSSDLPKLGTELTKIGHIFRKQNTHKRSKFSDNFIDKSWSPSLLFFTERKKIERFDWFLMPKNDFESTNFTNLEEVVHNFGWSDDDMN